MEENSNGDVRIVNERKLLRLHELLSSEETRERGMFLMQILTPQLTREQFIQNCIKWMNLCCNKDYFRYDSFAFDTFERLIEESVSYPELSGNVSNFIRTKFFPEFFKCLIDGPGGSAWKYIELCITHYKGACNAYQERLKHDIKTEFGNDIEGKAIANIFSYLPMLGESGNEGINYMDKWKSQFEETLVICYSILQDLFKDVVEAQVYDESLYHKYSKHDKLSVGTLYTYFHNYCTALQAMLLNSFPVPKSIMPQKVFNVICRCLNVTSRTLGNLDTTKKITLSNVLPQFHVVANSLLKALIVTCKTQLLPYSLLITKLMNQTIQTTNPGVNPNEHSGCLLRLRISTYDIWRTWAIVSNGAGALQSETLALAALNDITFQTKKPEDLAKQEVITAKTENLKNAKLVDSLWKSLCITALKVLQVYVREVGAKSPTDQLNAIQMTVSKNILEVQLSRLNVSPYSSAKCRYGLYALLQELVNCQCCSLGSPVNWGLEFFRQGLYDPSREVASFCSSALANIQNIIDQEVIRVAPVESTEMEIAVI